jgi:hypothetical protein
MRRVRGRGVRNHPVGRESESQVNRGVAPVVRASFRLPDGMVPHAAPTDPNGSSTPAYPFGMAGAWEIAERLEMLLVLQWLDEDRPVDGCVVLSIATAASELDLSDDEGLLEVMGALSMLEEQRRIEVTWPRGPGAEARVQLASGIRDDAARLFGDA